MALLQIRPVIIDITIYDIDYPKTLQRSPVRFDYSEHLLHQPWTVIIIIIVIIYRMP